MKGNMTNDDKRKLINKYKPRTLPIIYGYYMMIEHVWHNRNRKDKDLEQGRKIQTHACCKLCKRRKGESLDLDQEE